MTTDRAAIRRSSVEFDGGSYVSMDAWRRSCDTDLRFFLSSASRSKRSGDWWGCGRGWRRCGWRSGRRGGWRARRRCDWKRRKRTSLLSPSLRLLSPPLLPSLLTPTRTSRASAAGRTEVSRVTTFWPNAPRVCSASPSNVCSPGVSRARRHSAADGARLLRGHRSIGAITAAKCPMTKRQAIPHFEALALVATDGAPRRMRASP
jgi:hypothetical protein